MSPRNGDKRAGAAGRCFAEATWRPCFAILSNEHHRILGTAPQIGLVMPRNRAASQLLRCNTGRPPRAEGRRCAYLEGPRV